MMAMMKKSKKKPKYITDNIIRSTKGTTYIRYSTNAHPMGAGKKKIVFVKKKKKK